MPSVYFLSYARPQVSRQQAADQVDRFDKDLAEILSNRIGGDRHRLGFRDASSIEAGTPSWSEELARQITVHPIGLVLLSPQYLEQERKWCHWEYKFLSQRNEAISQIADDLMPQKPRLLLVIDWIRTERRDFPENFLGETQNISEAVVRNGDRRDTAAVRFVLDRGLWETIKLVEVNDDEAVPNYRRFMHCLAAYLFEQWNRWQDLSNRPGNPARIRLPSFSAEGSWTPARRINAAAPANVRQTRAQRRKVFVVYMAARPREVPPSRKHRYTDDGEYDWKPFVGAVDDAYEPHVGELLKCLEGVDVREWGFDDFREHMEDRMGLAGRRYPVLFIVDPWTTTQLPHYYEVLQDYVDAKFDVSAFSVPIVLWNKHDPEAQRIKVDFDQHVAGVFGHNRWELSDGHDSFQSTLVNVVQSLQGRIRYFGADQLHDTGSPLPRISPTVDPIPGASA